MPLFLETIKAIGDECHEKIYAMGNMELLKVEQTVAIIGSRKDSRHGTYAAYHIASKRPKTAISVLFYHIRHICKMG